MSTALTIAGYEYTRDQDALYLEALEAGYSRSRACKVSRYSDTAITVRIETDAEFRVLVEAAEKIGKDESIDRLNDMAITGVQAVQHETIVDARTGMPLTDKMKEQRVRKQDVRAAIQVAKIKNPEAFVEKKEVTVKGLERVRPEDLDNAAEFALRLQREREKEKVEK